MERSRSQCSLTTTARYHGHHDAQARVTTYYNIPYAKAVRFDFAKPIDEVEGLNPAEIVNATHHGPACPNFSLPPPYDEGFEVLLGDTPVSPQSEDCLTMDVYVPDGEWEDLPVYCKSTLSSEMPGGSC